MRLSTPVLARIRHCEDAGPIIYVMLPPSYFRAWQHADQDDELEDYDDDEGMFDEEMQDYLEKMFAQR